MVFDPFKKEFEKHFETIYFRLHGLGRRKYKYKFSDDDLKELLDKCEIYDGEKIYVLFNNYEMHNDCSRFLTLLRDGELTEVSWGAKAVIDTIDIEYPTTKDEILSKCGRWWVWIEPNKRIRVEEALKKIKQEEFETEEALYEQIEKKF
jgi:hypothetical protein